VLWLEWTSIYFSDKEVVFAVAKDVTERKQKEKEAEAEFHKLKKLATHFKSSIEKDRRYLTYELHEELAQLVFGLKMDVTMLGRYANNLPETSRTTIEHATVVSDMLIKTLQRISFSISPIMLDDFGLNTTLKWLCEEFSIINGIPCTFKSHIDEEVLTHEIKMDFFRICQESLTNIIEHAKAQNAAVSIKNIKDKIQLSIKDDGVGFDVLQQNETPGLISMRERTASINGQLTVKSKPGKGTTICVTISKRSD
jgi:signal transduction histidine kinase